MLNVLCRFFFWITRLPKGRRDVKFHVESTNQSFGNDPTEVARVRKFVDAVVDGRIKTRPIRDGDYE
jgi:hypothetical protein